MQASIIIPIYNTGTRLTRCIESVLSQTFEDYECLLVDDGSTEAETLELLSQYENKDKRLIVLHKVNGGVSSARNYGLQQAKGEWIVFVDSDDSIAPDHLEKLMSAATDDVDIVMTGFEDVRPVEPWFHSYKEGKFVGIECMKQMYCETDFLVHQIPWDRCYRNFNYNQKLNINNVAEWMMFNENLSLSEDRLFNYNYLMHCRGIATISDVTYFHDATDVNSLTYRKYSSSVNKYKYIIFKKATKALKERFKMSKEEAIVLDDYMEGSYSQFLNAYKDEGKILKYQLLRILHKIRLV